MKETIVSISSPPMPYYLECGQTIYSSGDQHPNRNAIGIFDLIVVQQGHLFIGEEQQQWTVNPAQMLILLPDRYHYSVQPCNEETHFYWMHFQVSSHWKEAIENTQYDRIDKHLAAPLHEHQASSYVIQLPKMYTLPYPEQIYSNFDKLIQLSYESRSFAFWQQQQLFWEMLRSIDVGQATEHATPTQQVAQKTEAFIKQNYHRQITNELLSEELHYHYNYITRCMKKTYGITPMNYLLTYRLEQAKLLLLKTEWPIAMIAEQVGFGYAAYFSRCFSKQYGIAPLQFRKNFVK